ncbi:hypothetical protein HDV05_005982 [Chytridiales sp. JEL 0842]|nr:hypothetical protein HDV05_005982 [Chytridiales sp. JEL 0842]
MFGGNQGTPAFGSSGFGAAPAFGASSFPNVNSTGAPTFGAAAGQSSSSFAAVASTNKSVFGASSSVFGGAASGAAPSFASMGSSAQPAFGSSTAPGGSSAFGSVNASSFGPPRTSGFGGSSAFGQPASTSSSVFGAPSASTSAFGAPKPATSAFGAASTGSSAFGAPSSTSSVFGAPKTGTTSVFGAPTSSAFGAPASTTGSAFGASSAPATSAFGASTPASSAFAPRPTTSAFGSTTSAFSAPSTAAAQTGFGSALGGGSAFGATSAFGAMGVSNNQGNAFGAKTANAGPSGSTSVFGAPSTSSAFGAVSAASNSVFGGKPGLFSGNKPAAATGSSTFGAQAATSNPFAVLQDDAAAPSTSAVSTLTVSMEPAIKPIDVFANSGPPKPIEVPPFPKDLADLIRKDLKANIERPLWKLSSYGVLKDEPCILAGADISPEEARFLYLNESRNTGNTTAYDPLGAANDMRKGRPYQSKLAMWMMSQLSSIVAVKGNNPPPFASGGPMPASIPVDAQSLATQQTNSAFGAVAPMTQPSATATTSAFGNTSTSAFSFTQAAKANQQPSNPANPFQSMGTSAATPFGVKPGLFSKPAAPAQGGLTPAQPTGQDEILEKARKYNLTLPSELTLTEQDLEQFRAMSFNPDLKIPEAPPPPSLRA